MDGWIEKDTDDINMGGAIDSYAGCAWCEIVPRRRTREYHSRGFSVVDSLVMGL